jgi:hypothetical protein
VYGIGQSAGSRKTIREKRQGRYGHHHRQPNSESSAGVLSPTSPQQSPAKHCENDAFHDAVQHAIGENLS